MPKKIDGKIRLYINNELYKEIVYNRSDRRKESIQKFLADVSKLENKPYIYYEIAPTVTTKN